MDTRFEFDIDIEIISIWTLVDLARLLDDPFYLWWEGYASHHFHPASVFLDAVILLNLLLCHDTGTFFRSNRHVGDRGTVAKISRKIGYW